MIRRRVIVHGRVQGVFFRDSVRRLAEQRGVAGTAANRDDGTVEAVFEGEPEAVEALVAFCRSGPRRAEVERVEELDEEPQGLQGFRSPSAYPVPIGTRITCPTKIRSGSSIWCTFARTRGSISGVP